MDRHKTRPAECGVCGKTFRQRLDGRPKTCSRSCARRHEAARDGPHNWKGGRYRTNNGYVKQLAKGHPHGDSHGYVMEHRLVMEKKLGRHLLPSERVHHKNGIRDDNREENLELWIVKGQASKDPTGQRVHDLIEHAMGQPELAGMDRESIEAAFKRVFLGEG